MTVYRSKVDVWLVALSVGIMAAACVPGLFFDFSWGALTACLLSLALVVSVVFSIRYEISGDKLRVVCCWIFIETFDIHKITSVKPTRTILSSPAASLDRIEVCAGRRSVVISPRSKQPRYLQPIITQYFIDNKSEIWLLFLIAHSKR